MALLFRAVQRLLRLPGDSSRVAPDQSTGLVANDSARQAANELSLGNAALADGQLEQALVNYSAAAAADPSNPKALLNVGYVQLEQNRPALAEQSLLCALALVPPGDALAHELHYLLGRARAGQSDWNGAAHHWQAVVDLNSKFAFAWRDLALAQEKLGRWSSAVDSMTRAIALTADATQEKLLLANLLLGDKRPEEALRWIEPLLAGKGETKDSVVLAATFVRAKALHNLRRFEEALPLLEQVQQAHPQDAEVLNSLGNTLMDLKQYSQALAVYEKVLALAPEMSGAWSNSGLALSELSREGEAFLRFDRAQALTPAAAAIFYNRASVHLKLLNFEASIAQSLAALAINPEDANLRWNLFNCYMLLGQFEKAWPEFEWRWRAPALAHVFSYPPYPHPRWNGHESLEGKTILLFPEQGLGDVIHFVRYVSMVAERALQVLLVVPEALCPVLTQLPANCKLKLGGQSVEASDYQCPLMSLPVAFGTTLQTIPNRLPYLHVDSGLVAHWRDRLGERTALRVGLVWSGNPVHTNDHNRSIALEKLRAAVSNTQGCQFFSLQLEIRESDRDTHRQWPVLHHFGGELKSFADTAALASCMDIVISVDTSVAHLVGALGLPLWLLIPYVPDWRWMLDRADTPWYPQARLFRQEKTRTWEPVLQQVTAELEQLAQAHGNLTEL